MDIQSKQIDRVFDDLARRYGLHKNTIRMIVITEFEFVKNTMKKVDSFNKFFPYIRLPFLCVFKVKNGKKEFFIEKSKKLIEDVYSERRQGDDRAENALDTGV